MIRYLKRKKNFKDKKINIEQYLYNTIYIMCRSIAIKRDFLESIAAINRYLCNNGNRLTIGLIE